ncbi:MAG TPA: hypothetical protein VFJ15_01580 [Oleiagrimonas sp.]|nr:hypothetical protein [Oleiagrimonas sp.]
MKRGWMHWACALVLVMAAGLAQAAPGPRVADGRHHTTVWNVQPSFKFDTLCFLDVLSADPFYLHYYQPVYAHFEPLMTPDVKAAMARIKHVIKDAGGGIISAKLALYYSVVPAHTLDQLIAVTRHPEQVQQALQATKYYVADGWKEFDQIRLQLITVFQFLKHIHFHAYWQAHVLPRVKKRASKLHRRLSHFNIVPLQEDILGHALPTNRITVYLLLFNLPHGIRITGTRFITNVGYPMRVVLMNAMHEMLHPPYDWEHDTVLRQSLQTLKADAFLMQRIKHHNPSFGYNSFHGFVEEDVVQASDQLVGEQAGRAYDPFVRWKRADDGMHVLAVALYELAHEQHYDMHEESMRDFIVRMVKAGKLVPGRIKPLYKRLYP